MTCDLREIPVPSPSSSSFFERWVSCRIVYAAEHSPKGSSLKCYFWSVYGLYMRHERRWLSESRHRSFVQVMPYAARIEGRQREPGHQREDETSMLSSLSNSQSMWLP